MWTRDGKEIVYNPAPGQYAIVAVATRPTFTFGNPVIIQSGGRSTAPALVRSMDISPNGQRIIGPITADSGGVISAPQIQVVLNWLEELKRLALAK